MPITSIVGTADTDFPEPLRPNLAKSEVDGKTVFTLSQVPDGFGVENIAAGRAKLTKLEQDLKRRDERLKTFAKDDAGTIYEPDEFKALLEDHKRMKEASGKQIDVEALRKQVASEAEAKYSGKLTAAEKRAAELDAAMDSATLNSVINETISELRPKDGKAPLVRLLLQNIAGVDKSEDGKRAVRVRTPDGSGWQMSGTSSDGFLPLKEYALNVLRTQHADLFQGDGASGAGAAGAAGRGGRYTFPRSRMNGEAGAYLALVAKAKAEGKEVVITDD